MSSSSSIPITPEQPYAVTGESASPTSSHLLFSSGTQNTGSGNASAGGRSSAHSTEVPVSAKRGPHYVGGAPIRSAGGESSDSHKETHDRGAAIPVGNDSGNMRARTVAMPGGSDSEVFNAHGGARKTYSRYTPGGRLARTAQPFTSDLSVGKFGVLAEDDADMLESRLLRAFSNDAFVLDDKSFAIRGDFFRALHLFLAINSGSIGNVTGRMGVKDDSQPLRFGDVEVSAADVAGILGDRAYSYMRARASQIRDTIESAFATANLPNAEQMYPGICRAVDLIKVVAAAKGLSQYPQYAAVGSQYAAGTPPYLISLIMDSAAKVLNTTQGNVRASEGPQSY